MFENSTMCKELNREITIFMLEKSVGKFHCGYWNVLEMSTVPVDIHMLENSISPVVWSCDIHHICWNFASVLVTVYICTIIFEALNWKLGQGCSHDFGILESSTVFIF
jgi:hypothetical protein